jgi:uncharacterized protein YjbI with pentapeptide repeats
VLKEMPVDLSGANLHDADLTGASLWGARLSEPGSIMQSGLLTSSSRTRIATERRWLLDTECVSAAVFGAKLGSRAGTYRAKERVNAINCRDVAVGGRRRT